MMIMNYNDGGQCCHDKDGKMKMIARCLQFKSEWQECIFEIVMSRSVLQPCSVVQCNFSVYFNSVPCNIGSSIMQCGAYSQLQSNVV